MTGNYSQASCLDSLESDKSTESDGVSKVLEWRNHTSKEHHASHDEENVLDDTGQSQDETAGSSNEEDGSDVETEGDGSVGEENEGSKLSEIEERSEAFCEWDQTSVDRCTDRCKVVEGDERVHLESLEEDLDHDEP